MNKILQGQKLTVTIEKLSQGGDGIARVPVRENGGPDFVVFVPHAAPGDRLDVEVMDSRKNFARGRIVKVIQAGEGRVEPRCSLAFAPGKQWACGGCNFQHLSYSAQLNAKTASFKETLAKISGLTVDKVLPTLGMESGTEWRYRNKIQVPFGVAEDESGPIVGFYAEGSHRIVPMEDCHIQSESMMAVLRRVISSLKEWKLHAYSDKTHRGWLRHVFIRQEQSSGKMLVVFVTANASFWRQSDWVSMLRKEFPAISGIHQNVNPEKTNVILGRQWRCLWGDDFLVETLDGLGAGGEPLKLKVSVGAFFQVNTLMAAKLYGLARDWALEDGGDLVLDLYTGVGGIALACASRCEKVIGVESVPGAIRNAQENARLNHLPNAEFTVADAGEFLKKLPALSKISKKSAVVLDPPRAGCQEDVLKHLLRHSPRRIVYVSCDPSTLARDLKILCAGPYALNRIQPLDLFPHSAHVESVTLLTRKT